MNLIAQTNKNWNSVANTDGIEILYAVENCISDEKLGLKVVNKNDSWVEIEFVLVTSNGNSELEHLLVLKLKPDEQFLIDCENTSVTPSFLDVTVDSKFLLHCNIKNLNVIKKN